MKAVFTCMVVVPLLGGIASAADIPLPREDTAMPPEIYEKSEHSLKGEGYALSEIIAFALENNPGVRSSGKDIEIETFGVRAARAERMPRLDLGSGVTRSRYASPVTPISGSPLKGTGFPEFDDIIYDFGVSFRLPLYRGGRLERGVAIAEIRETIARDMFRLSRQELVYDLTSVYYKILQLEKLLEASESAVKQLEAHRRDVELFLQAGTVPRTELLKTEVELAHARQNDLAVKNNLESAHELLKTLMGVDEPDRDISVISEAAPEGDYPTLEDGTSRALSQRPEYLAVMKKVRLAEERVRLAEGRRLPDIYLSGDYGDTSGEGFDFKENWNVALRLSLPLFDGGLIDAEVNRERKAVERLREEERALRHEIIRELRDARRGIDNAGKRIEVAEAALGSARENLRVERLKYEAGAGTSTDVIDAQDGLLRAETEYRQAIYDRSIAVAALRRAVGEDLYAEVSK